MAGQCLSSVNPVGGTDNLLVLEKGTIRIMSYYKYGEGTHYYEKDNHSDFDLITKAYYNYLSTMVGYGVSDRLTLEMESGYYFNKSQKYNTEPEFKLTGKGFSNIVISSKYNLFVNHDKRLYYSVAGGVKIPCSRNPQQVDHVELPVELQPTISAYGLVFNMALVKENSEKGTRYFFTNRVETNFKNYKDYHLGTAIFSSVFFSKHLMFSWLKGDWTTIIQIRNEVRCQDKISGMKKESSGGVLFFIAPQLNYVLAENWYLSGIVDVPFYQYFKGTQMGAGIAFTLSVSRSFPLKAE